MASKIISSWLSFPGCWSSVGNIFLSFSTSAWLMLLVSKCSSSPMIITSIAKGCVGGVGGLLLSQWVSDVNWWQWSELSDIYTLSLTSAPYPCPPPQSSPRVWKIQQNKGSLATNHLLGRKWTLLSLIFRRGWVFGERNQSSGVLFWHNFYTAKCANRGFRF